MEDKALRILVVDDDGTSRSLLSRHLKRIGFEVQECRDGMEALSIIEKSGPALLVLDYAMPELNGAEICAIIRQDADEAIAEIPIILLTGHAGADHEVECLNAGANDFVTKPVNLEILKARIDTHLRIHALRKQLQEQNRELEEWRHTHEEDLEAARLTQQAIIPQRPLELKGWEVASHYEPLIQVGGDIFGWEEMSGGRQLLWIADGTGHGASAALVTTLAAFLFQHAAETTASAAQALDAVNLEFKAIFHGRSFMTAMAVLLHPDTGRIEVAGAGHPPLMIVRADGTIEPIESTSPPIGLNGAGERTQHIARIDRGDTFLLYTDGLYGMQNEAGDTR